MNRVITVFDRKTERLVREFILPQTLDMQSLKRLYKKSDDDPMHDCFSVGPEEAAFFESILNVKFDLEQYEYFLECQAPK